MPHINIKHFPKDFTEEQKQQLSEALADVVIRHFDVPDGAVSIALEPVPQSSWNDAVVVPEISGRQDLLIKDPNY